MTPPLSPDQLSLDALESFMLPRLRQRVGQRSAARAWRWPRIERPSVWMERNIVLPPGVSNVPGPWRFDARPWGRRFVDFFADPGRLEILGLMGSQMGKSVLGGGVCLWGANSRPGPVNWLRETDDRAKEFNEDTLSKILQASPNIRRFLSQGRDAITKSALRMEHGTIRLLGAGAKTALQGRSPWLIFQDEYEKILEKNKTLGPAIERARRRVITWGSSARICSITTPFLEDAGSWQLWESSQQWLWTVPCPHCGAKQPMEFEHQKDPETGRTLGGIVWPRLEDGSHPDPDRLLTSGAAWYECPACLERIDEVGKANFVLSGSLENWTPDRPDLRTAMRVPSIASPDLSWSSIAASFLRALGKPASMTVFRTETLCLPVQSRDARPITIESVHQLKDAGTFLWGRKGPLEIGQLPAGVERLYLGVDAQKVEFWAVLLGLGYEGEAWNLWSGRLESKDDLRALENKSWTHSNGSPIWISLAGLDTGDGNRTDELYRWITTTVRFRALKGNRRLSQMLKYSRQDFRDPVTRQVALEAVDLCNWHTTSFQDKLQSMIDQGPGAGPNALHLPADVTREYVEHLLSERKREKLVDGLPQMVWEPVSRDAPNHMRDATCMALVAAAIDGWACYPRVDLAGDLKAQYLTSISGGLQTS